MSLSHFQLPASGWCRITAFTVGFLRGIRLVRLSLLRALFLNSPTLVPFNAAALFVEMASTTAKILFIGALLLIQIVVRNQPALMLLSANTSSLPLLLIISRLIMPFITMVHTAMRSTGETSSPVKC